MTTFGVTDQGFILKRLADILADMKAALSTVQDPVTGENLTPDLLDENDPLVQQVNAFADGLAAAWEQLHLAYNQFDPLKATGSGLAGLVQLNGIRKLPGSRSTVLLTLTGVANAVLPAGLQACDSLKTKIFTLPEVTFDGSGDATCVATCTVKGPTAAAIGTITRILTPYYGWSTVTNGVAAVQGTLEETTTQLRARQQLSTMTTAAGLVESVYGAIMNLPGVTYCRVYQNLTLSTDGRGIPSKNIAVVVQGGADADIAAVLWAKASAFPQYGSTEVTVTDRQGLEYTMRFIRPTQVDVYVDVAVTVVDAAVWPADGDAQIKNAIIEYASTGQGVQGAITGLAPNGWTIGETVYASELYIPVNSVGGMQVTALTCGLSAGPTGGSAAITWNQVAKFTSAKIVVTVS